MVNKTTAGAFSSQQFRDALAASGAKTLIVMGVETDYCVLSTVMASMDAVSAEGPGGWAGAAALALALGRRAGAARPLSATLHDARRASRLFKLALLLLAESRASARSWLRTGSAPASPTPARRSSTVSARRAVLCCAAPRCASAQHSALALRLPRRRRACAAASHGLLPHSAQSRLLTPCAACPALFCPPCRRADTFRRFPDQLELAPTEEIVAALQAAACPA